MKKNETDNNNNIPDSNPNLNNENSNNPSKPIPHHNQPKDTPHPQKAVMNGLKKNGNHEIKDSPAPEKTSIENNNKSDKKEVLTEININKDNLNVSRTIKENEKQSKKKNNSLPNANERTGGCSKCTIF